MPDLKAGFRNLEMNEDATVDLWMQVNESSKDHKEPIEWRSVTVSEDRSDGRDPIITRIPRRENPTVHTLQRLQAIADGDVHKLRLTFTDANGRCCGKTTVEVLTDLKRSSAVVAAQQASPDYQFARMIEAQQAHSMALTDRMFASVEKRENFVSGVLERQAQTTEKLHTSLVEAVGSIEGQRATDPTTVLMKGAWSMAKPFVMAGAEAGLEWVEEQGGVVKVGKRAVELVTNAGAKRDTLSKVGGVLKEVAGALRGDAPKAVGGGDKAPE